MRRDLARRDRTDRRSRSCRTVAAHEDSRHIGDRRIKSRLEHISLGRHSEFFKRRADNILSHSDQYHITGDTQRLLGSCVHRRRPAASVRPDHLRLGPQSTAIPFLVLLDTLRRLQEHQLDTFHHGRLDLRIQRSHILLPSPVHDPHIRSSAAKRASCRIHGNIAAADDRHRLAGVIRLPVMPDLV